MVTNASLDTHDAATQAVVTLAVAEVEAFLASLSEGRPEANAEALRLFLPELVDRYGTTAATLAADWYDLERLDANVPGRHRASLVVPDRARAEGTAARLGGLLFQEGSPLLLVLPGAVGAVDLLVKSADRDTITRASVEDPRAAGWERRAKGIAPCPFCRMLESRGAVYRQATADFAAHHHCSCAAVPSWDQNAPEVSATQYRASVRTSNMSDARRERHRAAVRSATAEFTE